MPISPHQAQQLFERLNDDGWKWREGTIYAPHETIWLTRHEPWAGDIVDFYESMLGRLSRLENNRSRWDVTLSVADTTSLVSILAQMQPG